MPRRYICRLAHGGVGRLLCDWWRDIGRGIEAGCSAGFSTAVDNELGDGGVGGGGGFPPRLHRHVQFFKLWSPQFLDEERLFLFFE